MTLADPEYLQPTAARLGPERSGLDRVLEHDPAGFLERHRAFIVGLHGVFQFSSP